GDVTIKPCAKILGIETCHTFKLFTLRVPPPIYLAGNYDDPWNLSPEGIPPKFEGGDLYLNMGPRGNLRKANTEGMRNEGMSIRHIDYDDKLGGEIVRVQWYDRASTFAGVKRVIAYGSDGFDVILTDPYLDAPVTVYGGDDRDFIKLLGSGDAYVDAGTGDDTIEVNAQNAYFVFGDGFGRDELIHRGQRRVYDFSPSTEALTGTWSGNRLAITPSGQQRRIIGDATINGRTAKLIPLATGIITAYMPGHGFKVGDRVSVDTPGWYYYTGDFDVVSVSGNTFEFEAADFLGNTPKGTKVEVCVMLCDTPLPIVLPQYVSAFHDGVNTVYLQMPKDFLPNGGQVQLRASATAYNGTINVSRLSPDWVTFNVPYADIREDFETGYLPELLYFGSGNDRLTINGGEVRGIRLEDNAGGEDTITVAGSLEAVQTIVPNTYQNRNLNLVYSGIDQFNVVDPVNNLTLVSDIAGQPIMMGPIGVGAAATSVTLPVPLVAKGFEVNSRQSFVISQPITVDRFNIRIFGDDQSLTIPYELIASESIQLVVADGTLTLPQGIQLSTSTAVIKAEKVVAPSNYLKVSADTFTMVTSPQSSTVMHVENDRDLTLTNKTDSDHLILFNEFLDLVFPGLAWRTSASQDWKDQISDSGSNPYAVSINGDFKLTLPAREAPTAENATGDEDTLRVLGSLRSYGGDLMLTADELDFLGGANSIRGTKKFEIRAATPVWTYRLGTSAEGAGGGIIDPIYAPGMLDLPTRDIEALADGFTLIDIGSSAAGNEMKIGDLFNMTKVKFTGVPRFVDASIKDAITLRSEEFLIEGDARAPQDAITLIGKSAQVMRTNVHTPNLSNIDAGLIGASITMNLADNLQMSGFLLGTNSVVVSVTDTENLFSIVTDNGSTIQTSAANGQLELSGNKSIRIAGRVQTDGANSVPNIRATERLDVIAGGDVATLSGNVTMSLTAGTLLTLHPGSNVRAGVTVDFTANPPAYTVLAPGANVSLDSPHELLIGGLVVASGGATVEAGTPISDNTEYFDNLTSADPNQYLAGQSIYAVLVTGTMAILGANRQLDISTGSDLIVYGNISVTGANSKLRLQSDTFTYVEGEVTAASGVEVYGGVKLDGTSIGGSDDRGTSVYFGKTGRTTVTQAGGRVVVRGAKDVDIRGAIVPGGSIGPEGVTWAGDGSSIHVVAGEQLMIDSALQAAGNVTIEVGTPGPDDNGRPLIITTAGGLNSAGLGADGAGGVVRIVSGGDLELGGNITAGATIRQTFDGEGDLASETYQWSNRPSRLEVVAAGRALIGADSVDSQGAPVKAGAYLRASQSILIDGGTHASGQGVLVYPSSEINTFRPGSTITIVSDQDAAVLGLVVAGGDILKQFDPAGGYRGRSIVRNAGDSTIRVEAGQQAQIAQDMWAGKGITVIGGIDPVDANDPLSGRSVLLQGSAQLRADWADGGIELRGPSGVEVMAAAYNHELVAANWLNSAKAVLANDVTLRITVDRGTWTYRGDVTVTAEATADNTNIVELIDDIKAAMLATDFTVMTSTDPVRTVGATYRLNPAGLELTASSRGGRVLLGSEFPFTLSGEVATPEPEEGASPAVAEGSQNIMELGFVVAADATAASAERLGIFADGDGATVAIGASTAPKASVRIGARVVASGSITVNTDRDASIATGAADFQLPKGGSLKSTGGNVVVTGSGGYAKIEGGLQAPGTGGDVRVTNYANIDVSGLIEAGDEIVLEATAPGGTDPSVNLMFGGEVRSLNKGALTITASKDIYVDVSLGIDYEFSSLNLASTSGKVVMGPNGGFRTSGKLALEAESIDFRGRIVSTATSANATDYTMIFKATNPAGTGVRMAGNLSVAGSVQVISPNDIVFDGMVATQTGANSGWDITAPGNIRFGTVTAKDGGGFENRGARVGAAQYMRVNAGGWIEVAAGAQLFARNANSVTELTAGSDITVIGTVVGGGTIGSNGATTWTGNNAKVTMLADKVTVGGLAPDSSGTMVTFGGVVHATGDIALMARTLGADSKVVIGSLSNVQGDPTPEARALAGASSKVSLLADGSIDIFGTVGSQQADSDIELRAAGKVFVDGLVDAADQLEISSVGSFSTAVGLEVTPLLLRTNADGHLIDGQGRLIDDQGRLVNADGEFVDASGNVLASDATPVFGGAPVRLGGGTLDAGNLRIAVPNQLLLDGMFGAIRSANGRIESDMQTATIDAKGDIRLSGRFQAMKTIDIRAANLTTTEKAVVFARESAMLLANNVAHIGYGASDSLFVINAVNSVELTGLVQSGDDIHVNAGVNRGWNIATLLGATLQPSSMTGGTVSVIRSGILDAKGDIRVVSGTDVRLAADVVLSPNLASVSTPQIVTVPHTYEVLTGPVQVPDGFATVKQMTEVTTTVTEQNGVQQIKIGTEYHSMDIMLLQDGFYNGSIQREFFVQNVDYENETLPWTTYRRMADGTVIREELAMGQGEALSPPPVGTTFAGLTDDQRLAVLDYLGYMPLYNFVYSNPQTHRVINGNATTTAWTPEWAGNANTIITMNFPGLDRKYIRLPDGAQLDFLRAVSRGATPMEPELVGRYRDHADVHYFQDRSGNWAEDLPEWDDLDDSERRWYVTAVPSPLPEIIDGNLRDVRSGTRQYEVYDGRVIPGDDNQDRSVSHVYEPIWREVDLPNPNPNCIPSANPGSPDGRRCTIIPVTPPNTGYDVLTQLVMAQAGYLDDSAYLLSQDLVNTRPHQWVAIQRVVNDVILSYQMTPYSKGGWVINPSQFGWTPVGPAAKKAAEKFAVSWGNDVESALMSHNMPQTDPGLDVNGTLQRRGVNLADVFRYELRAREEPVLAQGRDTGPGAYAIDHMAYYDYNVYYKRYEDFKDYEYHWIGKWHDIRDARMQYAWQWITRPEDVYGTQPSFATR
ncbi:MAG: hypothetical protein RLY70_4646, partial [Planctomycetota bacterium]